jgi:hypothetical protein
MMESQVAGASVQTVPPRRRMRRALAPAALAALFLAAHLPALALLPADIDAINFVLGVRDFDVTSHQPHPPGYPVFIALGKLASAVLAFAGEPGLQAETRGLSIWSALFGALAVLPLVGFFRCLELDDRRALAAVVLTVTSPLFWFSAVRPLSDVTGLFMALLAQMLLATALVRPPWPRMASDRALVAGAGAAALAIGVRAQALWLTIPLLLVAVAERIWRRQTAVLWQVALAFLAVLACWAVPLVLASGGWQAYLAAIGAQAAEDFADVGMLWQTFGPRRTAFALIETFVHPWAFGPLAALVLVAAAVGAVALVWRRGESAQLLALAAGPYALFHLLFQDTVITRYALPLVPPVAYLAVRGFDAVNRRAMPALVAVLAIVSVVLTHPATVAYSRDPAPAFAAMVDLESRLAADLDEVVGLHHVFERSVQVAGMGLRGATVLPAPPRREWLHLAGYWRDGGRSRVWYLADPRRTDLALIDPESRHLEAGFRWRFDRHRFAGGIRPDIVNLLRIDSPPAWFCAEGWHLTTEARRLADRRGRPDAVAYARAHDEAALLFIGGEHAGPPDAPDARLEVTVGGWPLAEWRVSPHEPEFVRRFELSAGMLSPGGGTDLIPIVVTFEPAEAGGAAVPIRLTQFELRRPGDVFFVFSHGWHEREHHPVRGWDWRWMSDRASVYIASDDRDVTLRIAGESPLRYFDRIPQVVVRAGPEVLARRAPDGDFDWRIRVPADALERAGGVVTLETDLSFVPDDRVGSGDRRRLGLRIFEFSMEAAGARPPRVIRR